MIGIFDYGVGNLQNLKNAIDHLELQNCIVQNPDDLESCDRMLLPGVGAFSPAMENLRASGMFKKLEKKVRQGMPLLGICLGAQLLLDESSEDGRCQGLGWIPGKVRRFKHSLKVPQMGWNQVKFQQQDPIFEKLPSSSYFYFVHSYFMEPETSSMVLGTTDYGHDFASVVHRENLWGVQFHPEKSQQAGLDLLNNFCTMELESKSSKDDPL